MRAKSFLIRFPLLSLPLAEIYSGLEKAILCAKGGWMPHYQLYVQKGDYFFPKASVQTSEIRFSPISHLKNEHDWDSVTLSVCFGTSEFLILLNRRKKQKFELFVSCENQNQANKSYLISMMAFLLKELRLQVAILIEERRNDKLSLESDGLEEEFLKFYHNQKSSALQQPELIVVSINLLDKFPFQKIGNCGVTLPDPLSDFLAISFSNK